MIPSSMADEKAHDGFIEDVEQETPETIAYRKKEAALLRKLDLFIAPVMMMLMLISYLDRGNIGFAATQGMITDIGLKGSELNVCIFWRKFYSVLVNLVYRLLFRSSISSTFLQRQVEIQIALRF
jgi:hypothetical protein